MSALAARLNVPAEWVVDWESGERFPTKKHHDALVALKTEGEEKSPDDRRVRLLSQPGEPPPPLTPNG